MKKFSRNSLSEWSCYCLPERGEGLLMKVDVENQPQTSNIEHQTTMSPLRGLIMRL